MPTPDAAPAGPARRSAAPPARARARQIAIAPARGPAAMLLWCCAASSVAARREGASRDGDGSDAPAHAGP
ncbi:hypothetical protein [Sorangium sp. So ce426]|uniref:hypothetical protein n=1 Tax=Sorangium sp. So ce426 TaxID=3133312 RepID=UPI003F5B9500